MFSPNLLSHGVTEKPQEIIVNPNPPRWETSIVHAPLYKRGWTIQERALSSQIIRWARDALYWESSELVPSEFSPDGRNLDSNDHPSPLLAAMAESGEIFMNLGLMNQYPNELHHYAWLGLINRYSLKRFAHNTD
jgi:hypothetical protein